MTVISNQALAPASTSGLHSRWNDRRSNMALTSWRGSWRFHAKAHGTTCSHPSPSLCDVSTATISMPPAGSRQVHMPSKKELERMQLPSLAYSFPSMLHPHYEHVKAECDAWIERVAQPPSESGRHFLHDCLLPRLVCRFIPGAEPKRLPEAIKLMAWLMISDDEDGHQKRLGSDVASTFYRAERIMGILTQPAHAFERDHRHWNLDLLDDRLPRRCSRRLAALTDLWQEISPQMTPLLRSRFISTMADYLEGIKMQVALCNKEARVPDMESYLEMRRHASIAFLGFIIAEYACGVELDEKIIDNANVVELRNKAVDYISFCNDIFSCYKDINPRDMPSIVYTHTYHNTPMETPSFEATLHHVAQRIQQHDAFCVSLITFLKEEYSKPPFDPLTAHHVHAYVDIISRGMSGVLAWLSETHNHAFHIKCVSTNRENL